MVSNKDKAPLDASGGFRDIMSIYSPVMDQIGAYLDKKGYPFYAVILGRDGDARIKDFVANNWVNLHYMSGPGCLLLSIYPPKAPDKEVAEYWKGRLGDDYEGIMEKAPTSAWSYGFARNLNIEFDKLPCLYLATSLQKGGLVIKLPAMGDKDLTSLFEYVFGTIEGAAKLEAGDRLMAVEKQVDGFYGRYSLKLGEIYVKNHWMEYVSPTENAKKVIEILVAGALAGLKAKVGAT